MSQIDSKEIDATTDEEGLVLSNEREKWIGDDELISAAVVHH